MLLRTMFFCSNVPHWFAKIYAIEFALIEYHLVLETITLIVRNTVEGARYIYTRMDFSVHVAHEHNYEPVNIKHTSRTINVVF